MHISNLTLKRKYTLLWDLSLARMLGTHSSLTRHYMGFILAGYTFMNDSQRYYILSNFDGQKVTQPMNERQW